MLAVSSDLREMKAGADEAPAVPLRPSEEELRNTITHRLRGDPTYTDHHQDSREDAIKKEEEEEEEKMKSKEEDQVVSDECVSQDGAVVQKEKALTKKKKVKKKKNPFMPNITAMNLQISGDDVLLDFAEIHSATCVLVKSGGDVGGVGEKVWCAVSAHIHPNGVEIISLFQSKLIEKRSGEGGEDGTAVTEKKTLVEQLNEFHLARVHCQDEENLDSLMEWWSSVKQWEPMSKDEDMTEKEEAKAFALTAEKVQRGIRVFHQLFSERAETLWQHIIDLNLIADGLDRFNKRSKVVQITGGSTSAVGGVATIAGLALAPVTMGTSLIVTAVGLGVAAAGGLASASAGISNSIHGTLDRRKVERIVKDFQSKMADIDKCTRFIKLGVENLREFRGPKVKKLKVYDGDLCGTSNIYEDGVMAGKAVLISANEITRFTEATMVTGRTAARAVQVAAMATGILTGLFVAMDLYFVAKDSHELRKGAKSELARKIREVVEQLHEGLVELNIIREELKCSQSSAFSVTSISNPMPSFSTSASTHHTSTTSCSLNSGISTSSNTLTSTSISSSLSQKAEAHTEP